MILTPPRSSSPSPPPDGRWVDVWAASLIPDKPRTYLPQYCTAACFANTTIRQTLRVTLGANLLRITVSNLRGQSILNVTGITAAIGDAGSPTLRSEPQRVTFGGHSSVDIPIGAQLLSDPIPLSVTHGTDVAISIYLAEGQLDEFVTAHMVAKTNSWLAHGDGTTAVSLPGATPFPRWYFVSNVQGWTTNGCALACFGDSITDRGDSELPINEYTGWPDLLSSSLVSRGNNVSVLNLGISGDRLWEGGLGRFEREVLRPGVRAVLVLMGVNDLGFTSLEGQAVLYDRLVLAFDQLIERSHAANVRIGVSTIMPFLSPPEWPTPWPFADATREQTRLRLNDWIRLRAHQKDGFDYLVDWARVVCEPDNEHLIQKRYQLTDYLHPNEAGYAAMAESLDLTEVEKMLR